MPVEAADLDAHVVTCADCAAFEGSLGGLDVLTRAGALEPAYDPLATPAVPVAPVAPVAPVVRPAARIAEPERRAHRATLALRIGIVLLALGDLYLALGQMLDESEHEAHEAGSFVVALCVALVWAAARPAYARAYVPVVGSASLLLALTSTADVSEGHVTALHEARHLGLVLATLLLWLLSRTESDRPRRTRQRRPEPVAYHRPRPVLRVVTRGALSRLARTVAALGLASLVLLVPSSASAHAVLETSTPRPDSVLATLPASVTLTYDESVTLVPSSLRVYGPDGSRVDRGDVGHRGGRSQEIGVSLGAGAGEGTYLVSWRVISADSHPVSGAFTFSVGKVSATPVAPPETSSTSLGVALGAARWAGYVGSALLVGILVVIGWCWRAGWSSRRARGLMTLGGVLLAVGSVASLLLKGPYDAALGLGATFHGDLLREVLGSTYGRATVARLVLALAGLALVWRRVRSLRVAVVLAVLVGVSFALAGHAAAGSGHVVAAINDTVHVLAASVWLGGLVLLLAAVLPAAGSEAARVAVARFSGLALGAVVLLVATGLYQAIRQVGSVAAATGTTYGRELLVKVGIVLVVVVLAALSRRRLQRLVADGGTIARLRAVVAAEAVLILVVLGVTSALVATEPAKTAYHPSTAASLVIEGDTVQVSAIPAGNRTVELHLYVFGKDQQPSDPREITATVSLPSQSIDALPVQLQNAGPGHRQAVVAVPMAGDWQLAITVRTTAIDEATGYVTLPIR